MVALAERRPANDARRYRALPAADLLGRYYRDIGQFAQLQRDEEVEAAKTVLELDRRAWELALARPESAKLASRTASARLADPLPALEALMALDGAPPDRRAQAVARAADELRAADPDRELLLAVAAALATINGRRSQAFAAHLDGLRAAMACAVAGRNAIAAANLRLVAKVAREYDYTNTPLEDRIQEGNIGMLRAIGRFDYRHGVRFATYAIWWVRNAIWRYVTGKEKAVRVPAHVRSEGYKVLTVTEQLTASLGRPPTIDEIAAAVELPESRVHELRQILTMQSVSLDHGFSSRDDDELRLIDRLEDREPGEPRLADTLEQRDEVAQVLSMASELPEIELQVLRRRFGLDGQGEATLAEIGDELGLSRERIRQVQNQALSRLRRMVKRAELLVAAVA